MADYNESFALTIENDVNEPAFRKYLDEKWGHSLIYSGVYLIVVFGGKWYMNGRPAFDLRPILAVWSGVLAIFSILGTVRTLPIMLHNLRTYGFEHTVCINTYYKYQTIKFWAVLFTLSKVYELGDTIFIILRKQRLIFLHWYHHITVLVYCWHFYSEHNATVWWFMIMNFVVHSLMYTYYTLRAMRIRVPRAVSIFITTLQLAQMVMGLYVCIAASRARSRGDYCAQSSNSARYGILMYGSYFVLFAQFFYTTYLNKPTVSFKKED